MVKSIGMKLEFMNETMASTGHIEQKKSVCVEVSKGIVDLWLNIILAFRNSELTGLESSAWAEIMGRFERMIDQLEEASKRISRIVDFAVSKSRADEFERLQSLLSAESAGKSTTPDSFPCQSLPSAQNPRFFGRENELENIHQVLSPQGPPMLRSISIFGLGGVGKSQIALKYAYEHIKDYDAIFWIHAQTSASMDQSVTDAVRLLGIEEAGQETQNRIAFHNWLKNTGEVNGNLLEVCKSDWSVL